MNHVDNLVWEKSFAIDNNKDLWNESGSMQSCIDCILDANCGWRIIYGTI